MRHPFFLKKYIFFFTNFPFKNFAPICTAGDHLEYHLHILLKIYHQYFVRWFAFSRVMDFFGAQSRYFKPKSKPKPALHIRRESSIVSGKGIIVKSVIQGPSLMKSSFNFPSTWPKLPFRYNKSVTSDFP